MATGGQAKVYGVGMKDRGAILPAGHGADGAFLVFRQRPRARCPSTYYGESAAVVGDGIERIRARPKLDERRLGPAARRIGVRPVPPGQQPLRRRLQGSSKPTFPYDLNALREANGGYDLLKGTPGGNTLIVDFALAAIDGPTSDKTT